MNQDYIIATELCQVISPEQAYKYRIVPYRKGALETVFLTDADATENLASELKILLGLNVALEKRPAEIITQFISANYRRSVSKEISEIHFSNDFLEKILVSAREVGSSDIHFEIFETRCRIRFRMDGKLKVQFFLPLDEYPVIVNKIKIRAQLDISEKRLPQDGRITVSTTSEDFDIRVSTMPTLFGEKIVLRILSKDTDRIDIENLGLTQDELQIFLESIKKPNGIVLISGPTGSGKTTTLYATLKKLNSPSTNILTVEDPIEYTLEGVNQVQLKENIGLDFAATLRTFLRQDPDVIMVGEIRDAATANMAIRAALTGHLVLSTIHTNSAWATVSRLIDMGIPPFFIASTLNLSVAQRLLRKLCEHCKKPLETSPDHFPTGFRVPDDLEFHFIAQGCEHCFQTGYHGRQALYEILQVNGELIEYIKNGQISIERYIEENKIRTLQQNALALVRTGVTSVEEAYPLLMQQ